MEVEAVSPPSVTEPVASTSTTDTSGSKSTETSVPEPNEIDYIDPDLLRDAMEIAGLIPPRDRIELAPPSDPIIHNVSIDDNAEIHISTCGTTYWRVTLGPDGQLVITEL